MSIVESPREAGFGAGHVAAAAIAAFAVYAVVGGLEGTGRSFVVLGALRIVLFGALLGFALAVGAQERRLGRVGLAIAGTGAVCYLLGGIGSVATDGWSYDVFGDGNEDAIPWYAVVIGLSGILFALGTVLVGIAGRRAGRLATAVILAGILFPVVFALQDALGHAGAHLVWLAAWMAVAVGLIAIEGHGSGRRLDAARAR